MASYAPGIGYLAAVSAAVVLLTLPFLTDGHPPLGGHAHYHRRCGDELESFVGFICEVKNFKFPFTTTKSYRSKMIITNLFNLLLIT